MTENRMKAANSLATALEAVTSQGDKPSSRAMAVWHIATALQHLGLEVEADCDKREPLRLVAKESTP